MAQLRVTIRDKSEERSVVYTGPKDRLEELRVRIMADRAATTPEALRLTKVSELGLWPNEAIPSYLVIDPLVIEEEPHAAPPAG